MVGNKHKNGIICTFPNCNKPMRTQKFKMHFTRVHLQDGEVYSVEHRRQYEVAREENARSFVKHEFVGLAPEIPPSMSMVTSNGGSSCEQSIHLATASSGYENAETLQAKQSNSIQSQQIQLTSQAEVTTTRIEENATNISVSTYRPSQMYENDSLSGEHISGRKRSALAVTTSAETDDPTGLLLMQFIALMDQRFQELVSKMGEMIDVQKDLIDTLQASNPHGQASTSAFSHAVDVVMKRRKKDTIPCSDNNGSGQDTSSNKADTEGDRPPSSGFVL